MVLIVSGFLGTLDYSCKEAPSPVQEKENRANLSLFDRKHHYTVTYTVS